MTPTPSPTTALLRAAVAVSATLAVLLGASQSPGSTTVTAACTYDLFGTPMTVSRQLTLYVRSDGRNVVKDGDAPQAVAPGAILHAYVVIQSGPIGDAYQPYTATFADQTGTSVTLLATYVDLNGSEGSAALFTAPAAAGTYRVTATVTLTAGCTLAATLDADVTVASATPVAAAPGDTIAPSVLVMGALARAGGPVTLSYLIRDESGPTQEVIDIRRTAFGRPVASWSVKPGRKPSWQRVRVTLPKRVGPGRWKWCVTAVDQAGNRSRRTCGNLAIV